MSQTIVALPRGDEYVGALQHPSVAFRDPDLRAATIESRPGGLPRPYTGGFTMTFHASGAAGEWAVRCFTRDVRELARRYDAIGRFTSGTADPAFARAELIADGILVAGKRHPFIKMEWVRGPQLNAYVDKMHGDAAAMTALAEDVLALGLRMEGLGIAHGDLQHGNVLVTPDGRLRLVDYDDLYLPELSDLRFSSGLGHQNFQHPGRTSGDFGPHMDRFSLYAIYVALLALAADPKLWQTYDGGDEKLLFKRDDYADPEASPIFADLARRDALSPWIDRLAAVCRGPFDKIPAPEDFIAGRFHYDRYVPGAPRKVVRRPAPRPRPLPRPAAPPPVAVARAARAVRSFDFVTAGIVAGLLALGAVFHDALYHFAFPGSAGASRVARGAAHRPAHRHVAVRLPSRAAVAEPVVTQGSQAAHTTASVPRHETHGRSERSVAAASARAHGPAAASHGSSAATANLLDAAAADVATAPKCNAPDAPAHVVAEAVPVVAKSGAASTGAADVTVGVTPNGQVASASIASSSGSPDLDAAALDAARRSTYAAAIVNCKSAASSVALHVRF